MMKVNDLLALLDREVQLLAGDNFHAASVAVGLAAQRLREMANAMRIAGFDPDNPTAGRISLTMRPGEYCTAPEEMFRRQNPGS